MQRKNSKNFEKELLFYKLCYTISLNCYYNNAERGFSMEILKNAFAGTMESSDAYVEIMPGDGNIEIQLESVVKEQFGKEIEEAIKDVLEENEVKSANIRVVDRGALECVIRARVETAILRGKGNE